MTQSQLAYQAQAGDFLRTYKPRTNLNTLIHDLTMPSRMAFLPTADITTVVQFPDTSFYQKEIDFEIMRNHTRAIILRGGQNVWPDDQFERSYAEAKRCGLLVGLYWFFDDRASPGAQADKLREVAEGKTFELEAFIDWENTYGGAHKGLKEAVSMMQRVESFNLDVKDVGMYTGYYWFRANSNPIRDASQYAYLKNKPLWLAWYTNNPSNVLVPAPWSKLTHWQFGTPIVAWGQKTKELDMNFYNGSQVEFDDRYIVLQAGEQMNYITTTDAKLWRYSNGTSQIDTIKSGTKVIGDAFTSSEYVRLTQPIGYTKKIWLKAVTVEPPPPPPPPPDEPTIIKTHTIDIYNNGRISIDGGELI